MPVGDAGGARRKAPASTPAPPVVVAAPAPQGEKRRAIAKRKRAMRIRSTLLAIVLGGLAAWYFAGVPRDDIAEFAALAESYLPSRAAKNPVAVVDAMPTIAAAAATAPPVETESVPEEAAIVATETAADSPAPAEAADEPAASETVAQPDAPAVTLVQSLVTVYERDGAARITYRQPVGATTALFWWTGDDTATGDADYIALEAPVIAFAAGEEAETVHIPLVNDSLPEPREAFFVFLGQRSAVSGRLEPIARIRVEVNDDD
jgi:hypothetical protein